MKIFSYRDLKDERSNKTEYGFDSPLYWNKRADELFERFGIKRSIEIAKVIYGGSDYPCSELYFENGMNLHLDSFEYQNEETLKEYGFIK